MSLRATTPAGGGARAKYWTGTIHAGHGFSASDLRLTTDGDDSSSSRSNSTTGPDGTSRDQPASTDHSGHDEPERDLEDAVGHGPPGPLREADAEVQPGHDGPDARLKQRRIKRLRDAIEERIRSQFLGGGGRIAGAVFQIEEAPTTGTIHGQVSVAFTQRMRLTGVLTILRGSWKPCRTKQDWIRACEYARKEETRCPGPFSGPVELGEVAHRQGQRTDIDGPKELLDSGATMEEVADRFFDQFKKYHVGFEKYRSYKTPKRTWKTKVSVLWGPPGAGKTWWARSQAVALLGGLQPDELEDLSTENPPRS